MTTLTRGTDTMGEVAARWEGRQPGWRLDSGRFQSEASGRSSQRGWTCRGRVQMPRIEAEVPLAVEVPAYGDIFARCGRYTLAKETEAAGVYPYFRAVSDSEGIEVVIAGERKI